VRHASLLAGRVLATSFLWWRHRELSRSLTFTLLLKLSTVKLRMRSVQNIAKITAAMKMVAASKMRVAERNVKKSRGLVVPFIRLLGDLPGRRVAT
jgi:ATP synthase